MGSFHIGGAEKQLMHMLNYLSQKEFELILIVRTVEGPNKNLMPKSVKVIDLNTWTKIKKKSFFIKIVDEIKSILFLRSLFKNQKPDFVYGNQLSCNYHILASAFLLRKYFRPRLVFSIVNNPKKYTIFGKYVISNLYNNAEKIYACATDLKNFLENSTNIKNEKIDVMYNCISEVNEGEKIHSDETINKVFRRNKHNIIFVSRIIPQKGTLDLLKAFKIIRNSIDCNLIIIGDGVDMKKMKNNAKKFGLENNVIFLGNIPNSYEYVAKADAFVYTSKWDGLATVLLESFSVLTPVIATNAEFGTNDVVIHKKTGMLIPVGDYEGVAFATIEILKNKELTKTIIKNAEKRLSENFLSSKAFVNIENYFSAYNRENN